VGLIIFDFDGTIADSLEIFIETTNRLSKEFGCQRNSPDQVDYFRMLNLRVMIQQIGIPSWKLPFFLRRFYQEFSHLVVDLRLVDGMQETLLELKQQNHRLGIVTSNSRQNVEKFLHLQNLNYLFEFIYAGQLLSGKTRSLQKLVKLNRATPLLFVGDETSDVQAAKQAKITSVAVSWGFNHREALVAATPDFLIDHPEQLIGAIAQLSGFPPAKT
jgi:phosphoglycolate phosphatase-like HAD superfamily hydrolase